jgi:hypothetical protein
MKRWLKTFLVLVAVFLIPTLWLLISHIVAKHALERYKAQLRATGEKLTIDELLPPHIPPDQNGAKLFIQAFSYLQHEGILNSNPPPAMRTIPPEKAIIGWQQPWIVSQYGNSLITNTWNDIEEQLKKRALGLDLLYQAAARPGFDLGLDYRPNSISSSNLIKLKDAAVLLSAAAVSDLNRGETPAAVTNIHTLVILVNDWKDEPLLISQLVRIALAAIASTAQWEVLQSTNLTDPQLAMLQHDWESMGVVAPMENALAMERVWSLAQMDQLRTSNSPSASVGFSGSSGSSSGSSSGAFDFIKDLSGSASQAAADKLWRICWCYDDELREMEGLQATIDALRQIETNGIFDKALAEQDRKFKALGLNSATNNWLRTHLNDEMMGVFDATPRSIGRSINRLLRTESTRRCAITAIALKRYQLRHGAWPADLSALSPEFLSQIPYDPADGQPLHYHPNPDGTVTLYSMNWIWPQPATPEETRQYYTNLLQRSSVYK